MAAWARRAGSCESGCPARCGSRPGSCISIVVPAPDDCAMRMDPLNTASTSRAVASPQAGAAGVPAPRLIETVEPVALLLGNARPGIGDPDRHQARRPGTTRRVLEGGAQHDLGVGSRSRPHTWSASCSLDTTVSGRCRRCSGRRYSVAVRSIRCPLTRAVWSRASSSMGPYLRTADRVFVRPRRTIAQRAVNYRRRGPSVV